MSIPDLEPASENKPAKLDGPTQINVGLSALAIAAAFGFYVGDEGLRLLAAAVLLLLPGLLICLIHRNPEAYGFLKPRNDPRTDLGIAFLVCGCSLTFGNVDVHFVETAKMAEFTVLIGLLFCAGLLSALQRSGEFWGVLVGMFFFAACYGWGAAALLDTALDRSTPGHYSAMVEDMHETYHRGTSYHLVLDAWGPVLEQEDLTVSGKVYGGAVAGQPVCLELRLGWLRVQWYRVVPCEDQAGK